MPPGVGLTSKPPLSQEFVHSSDDEDELEGEIDEGSESVSAHEISGGSETPKNQPKSLIGEAGHEISSVLSTAESEREAGAETSRESGDDISADEAASALHEQRRLASTPSKPKLTTTIDHTLDTVKHSSLKDTHTIPVKPFKPPQGFRKLGKLSASHDEIVDTLANVEGNQVFHIVAPSSLPISAINQIDFSTIKTGAPTVEHRGKAYCLSELKSSGKGENLHFPSRSGTRYYSKAPTPVRRTYVFGPKIVDNDSSLTSYITGTWATDNAVSQPSKARTQPDHRLKYRNTPFGVPATPPTTDLDSNEEPPVFRTPTRITSPSANISHAAHPLAQKSHKKLRSSGSMPMGEVQTQDLTGIEVPASRKDKKKRKHDLQGEVLAIRTPPKQPNPSQLSEPQSGKKKKKKTKVLE